MSGFLIFAWPQSVGFQTWLDFLLSQFSRSMQICKVIKYFLQCSLCGICVGQKQEKRNKGCLGSQRKDFEGMTMEDLKALCFESGLGCGEEA